jgi:hypothetical protein
MRTSLNHEQLKRWIVSLLDDFLLWAGTEYLPHGSSTMQKLKRACAKPADSWCFKTQKTFPELVLEIARTSGGLPKLEVYRNFAVPEVWNLKRDKSACEGPAKRSRLLPKLEMALREHCLTKRTCAEARKVFGKALAAKR